jgi:hypothetical protein
MKIINEIGLQGCICNKGVFLLAWTAFSASLRGVLETF